MRAEPSSLERATWRYATPHNIQRNTPQTESCLSCHNNPEFFLTADKVEDFDRDANWDIIVDRIPSFPEGYEEYLTDEEKELLNSAVEAASEEDASDG